jgi:ElaB/YqjD/DUF883 family membrane-anchored ribosome-binding protein
MTNLRTECATSLADQRKHFEKTLREQRDQNETRMKELREKHDVILNAERERFAGLTKEVEERYKRELEIARSDVAREASKMNQELSAR